METSLIGEQGQGVGLDQIGDQAAQGVVIPEPDLIGGDRVVLVDDRDHAQLDQAVQRGPGIEVAGPAGDVVMGQQHLRGVLAVLPETAGVGLHQAHLPDRGRGLKFMQRRRALRPAEAACALRDRAGGDDHKLQAARG